MGFGASGPASSDASRSAEAAPSDVAYARVKSGVSLHDLKRSIERDCIVKALQDSLGNITKAAVLLGMKRPRLSQLVKQYNLTGGSEGADDAAAEDE